MKNDSVKPADSGAIRESVSQNRKRIHFDNVYETPIRYEDIIMYQIGDLSCEKAHVVKEHKQICHEISYVVSGSGYFYTNGEKYRVEKGDIFFSRPGEIHKCEADKENPYRYFYLGFSVEPDKKGNFSHIPVNKMFDSIKCPVLWDEFHIEVPFQNALDEIYNSRSYMDTMIKTYLFQIIIITYRNFFEHHRLTHYKKKGESGMSDMVYKVINYIDINLHDIVHLSSLEQVLGYSYSYISHLFAKETGITINSYYQDKRFEKAIELLKDPSQSITHISKSLQYQSVHVFSRAFRQKFGMPPTTYQDMWKNKKKLLMALAPRPFGVTPIPI